MNLFDYEDGREGYFGEYGGCFIPEILYSTVTELKDCFNDAKKDPKFWQEFVELMHNYSGRPTPVTYLKNLSEHLGGAQIYVKREDLNHTGSHKINNVMGQGLLCKRLGKKRIIAETGAGQHGFATATMSARMGFDCKVYMGAVDVARQRPNVFWMENLGAEVIAVTDGQQTLKDAINECMRDWVSNMEDTHYALGTACGPHPFPEIVSYFQSIVGKESREQLLANGAKLPDKVFACVGGGSNAMGIFQGFLNDDSVELVGVEAGGHGPGIGKHAARIAYPDATTGIAQGYKTKYLQNADGNMLDTHSVSAGLDYIGVSPILAHLADIGRVRFDAATDVEVTETLKLLMSIEGLIPALESTHAFVSAVKEAKTMNKDQVILVNQSGRGDKDIFTVAEALNDTKWKSFIKERADLYD
ncbi:tryptophan synthase subunit beta [Lentisphaera araneosa HTCC2155]|uniref:Tryptophan synthase beta chain n=1 Tax=Lentisphaera araneosa HTCC2155 TaxID=313628 RepID=A6DJV0_9BACT|nr:tryptophan synthase subunit beta [Lentisphaera araneosa]EDM28174.1 tryptophan synthase subunit beta [Lentisphaera araneosa HTCC2155]